MSRDRYDKCVKGYACILLSLILSHPSKVLFHHPSARSQEAAFEQLSPVHSHGSQDSMAEPNVVDPHSAHISDVVNVNLLLTCAIGLVLGFRVAVLVELKADTLVALVAVCVGLVDLCVLGELAVGF